MLMLVSVQVLALLLLLRSVLKRAAATAEINLSSMAPYRFDSQERVEHPPRRSPGWDVHRRSVVVSATSLVWSLFEIQATLLAALR